MSAPIPPPRPATGDAADRAAPPPTAPPPVVTGTAVRAAGMAAPSPTAVPDRPAGGRSADGSSAGDGPVARRGRWRADVGVIMLYVAGALLITWPLWRDPGGLDPASNTSDPPFFAWMLIHATRIFTQGENPLASPMLNAPLGVNLMANTGLLGLTVPLVPVTLLFGAGVSFALLTTGGLAGTATAWYVVARRHLLPTRLSAAVAGAFAGFAPGMINHANGHPNLIAQFLVPVIVWRALRMRRVRDGVILGLLVTWQAFINEELLFLTALAGGLFVAVYALARPERVRPAVRPFLRAGGVAVAVAGALLAYPLWYQFFGLGHYRGLPGFVLGYGADLASFPAFAKLSLLGQAPSDATLAPTPEENTFLGWPLLIALVPIVVWQWRRVAVRGLAAVGVVFFALSLGRTVTDRGRVLLTSGPWKLLDHLPLFDSVVPTRLALVLIPVIALLLGYAVAGAQALPDRLGRVAVLVALAGALLPVVPRPLPVTPRPAVPVFFTSGDWRGYLPPGRSILSADTTWNGNIEAMSWANATDQGYAVVGGYFLGPDPSGRGSYGPVARPTAGLLADVGYRGGVPQVTDAQRAQAAADVRYWRAGLVVLAGDAPHAADLRATLDQLFGPARRVDDVWLWPVSDHRLLR